MNNRFVNVGLQESRSEPIVSVGIQSYIASLIYQHFTLGATMVCSSLLHHGQALSTAQVHPWLV